MNMIVQTLINGILIGGIYALLAVGQTMIFGVLKIINFAQGEFLMIGLYLCWVLYFLMSGVVNSYFLIIPVSILLFFIGAVIMRFLVMPLLKRNDSSSYILLTIGLSYCLQYVAQGIWTSNTQSINSPIKTAAFSIGGLVFPLAKVISFGGAILLVAAIFALLKSTDLGRAIRATSENSETAQLLGVDYKKMYIIAFALGAAIAGAAASLLIPIYSIYPRIGQNFSTITFAVVVLGGLGNTKGALVAGLLIGVVENFTATYINSNISLIAVFVLFILVMLLKPNGLFSKGGAKL